MTKILLHWHVIERFKLLRSLDLGIVAKIASNSLFYKRFLSLPLKWIQSKNKRHLLQKYKLSTSLLFVNNFFRTVHICTLGNHLNLTRTFFVYGVFRSVSWEERNLSDFFEKWSDRLYHVFYMV